MSKSMFSLIYLDNLFLSLKNSLQKQGDTLEAKHLHISFVFCVALFPRTAKPALHAVLAVSATLLFEIQKNGAKTLKIRMFV